MGGVLVEVRKLEALKSCLTVYTYNPGARRGVHKKNKRRIKWLGIPSNTSHRKALLPVEV